MENDCIFCKIIKGTVSCTKVYEDDNFIAFLDINPKSDGHTLLIPKTHFRNLLDIPSTLGSELLDAIKNLSFILLKEKKCLGFNIIINNEPAAGQVVLHSHLHIIPRYKDDNLKGIV